ncbi:MAG: RidA family protein [Candidatus Heteroscillospira sp.]|jgi:2-iminobutanoate/2-iminopropanoate deaminase
MKFKFASPRGYIPAETVSQVLVCGRHAYLSGQISYDTATGEYPRDGMTAQARRVFGNIRNILEDLGLTTEDVVKCNVFISDMDLFQEMDAVYREFFGAEFPPARQTVTAGIWGELDIEVSAEILAERDIIPQKPEYIVRK